MTALPRRGAAPPDLLLLALFALPLAVSLAKLPIFPGAAVVARFISVADLPAHLREAAENIVFIPLGALVVIAFRLTLGLKVLGLFRPILLALAFTIIGVPLGLAVLVPVLMFVLLLRPLLASGHSYARLAVLLSLVAALLLVPLVVGKWWELSRLQSLAFFPVIALCLTCESFAKTADRDGIPEALWQALMTALAAMVITFVARLAADWELFLRFPELLLTQAGCVLLIKNHLDFRLFEGINPLIGQITPVSDPASIARLPDASPAVKPAVAQPLVGAAPIRGETR